MRNADLLINDRVDELMNGGANTVLKGKPVEVMCHVCHLLDRQVGHLWSFAPHFLFLLHFYFTIKTL